MQIIKRKILLETLKSRAYDSTWGTITATTINLLINIEQDIKDLGMMIPNDYIPKGVISEDTGKLVDYKPLIDLLGPNNYAFMTNANYTPIFNKDNFDYDVRYSNKTTKDYYQKGISVSGITEDKLEVVKTYGYTGDSQYIVGNLVDTIGYYNFSGKTILGNNLVISNDNFNPILYGELVDVNDINLLNTIPPYVENGIVYETFNNTLRTVTDEFGSESIPTTKVYYKGQGMNETNLDMSALTREEYLLYITQPPKVENEVFIERGGSIIFAQHGRLAEISNLEQLERYGNGFYKINNY